MNLNKENILIVDDDPDIIDVIEIYLNNEGHQIFKASNGMEALSIIDKNIIHLILLDIMMPSMDGFEVCRRIRKKSNIPIIVLSAKSNDIDKILGLGTGADDYIVKPFNPLEMVARVKSQLRRYLYLNSQSFAEQEMDILEIQGLYINKANHVVTKYNKEIYLTVTEYEILLLLASSPNRVFTTEDIFKNVWKDKYFDSNNTVMVHIWRIRKKIEDNPQKPQIIKNVWGVGYKVEKKSF